MARARERERFQGVRGEERGRVVGRKSGGSREEAGRRGEETGGEERSQRTGSGGRRWVVAVCLGGVARSSAEARMGMTKSKPKLSKEDLDFLKKNTNFTEEQIKEWYKGFVVSPAVLSISQSCLSSLISFQQDCPKGHLTKEQFIKVYKDFFPTGSAEGFCEHVFRTFDTGRVSLRPHSPTTPHLYSLPDNSGCIDFKEFLLAINVTSSGTPEQKLEWAFRMYDIDGNGTIDEKEMIKIIEVSSLVLGHWEIVAGVGMMDDRRSTRCWARKSPSPLRIRRGREPR